MRNKFPIVVASGLLIFSAVWIIHQSRVHVRNAGPAGRLAGSEQPPGSSRTGGGDLPGAQTADLPMGATAANRPSKVELASKPSPAEEESVATPEPGIRLANEVQLPAVILAMTEAEQNPQKNVPAPVAEAMRAIVGNFYRDIADGARDEPERAAATLTSELGPDDTLVIGPGPIVERARARANETYRALFGDDAYNRMTMNALKETWRPVEPGE